MRVLAAISLLATSLLCSGFVLHGGSGTSGGGGGGPALNCVGGNTDGSCIVAGDFTSTLTDINNMQATFYQQDANFSNLNNIKFNGAASGLIAGSMMALFNGKHLYVRTVNLMGASPDAAVINNWWTEVTNSTTRTDVVNTGTSLPAITTYAGGTPPNGLLVSPGVAAQTIGFTAPTDSFAGYSASLTIKATLLPTNGTWTLSDGVTPITQDQVLTSAQLTGSMFTPTSTGFKTPQYSAVCYTVYDPSQLGNIGCASLTVKSSGLWAQPPGLPAASPGTLEIFQTAQPATAGDVVGVRFENPVTTFTGGSMSGTTLTVSNITAGWLLPGQTVGSATITAGVANPGSGGTFTVTPSQSASSPTTTGSQAGRYVTFGQPFRPGDVPSGSGIMLKPALGGSNVYAQLDCKNTAADGSCIQGNVTALSPSITTSPNFIDYIIATCATGSTCPAAPTGVPSAATLAANGYNAQATITYRPAATTDAVSCHTILANANAGTNGATINTFMSGPAVAEYDVRQRTFATNTMYVGCDIKAYADGSTVTDIVFDNTCFSSCGADRVYDVAFTETGENLTCSSSCLATTANGAIPQFLFSMWCHEVYQQTPGTGIGRRCASGMPNVVHDSAYLSAAGAIPKYDYTFGAADSYMNQYTYVGGQAPYNTGSLQLDMGGNVGGPRPDIAPIPGWCTDNAVSQNAVTYLTCMGNADVQGTFANNLTDESTGRPLSIITHPDAVRQTAGTFPSAGTWNAACQAGCANGYHFFFDSSHAPDPVYYPYIVSGNHFRLYQLEQLANTHLLWVNNNADSFRSYGPSGSYQVGIACQFNYTPSAFNQSCGNQTRSLAWELRTILQAASRVPDADPLQSYFRTVAKTSVQAMVRQAVVEGFQDSYGPMRGYWGIIGPNGNGNSSSFGFQNHYLGIAMGIGLESMVPGIAGESDAMVRWLADTHAGAITNANQGFPPMDGDNYHSDLATASPGFSKPFSDWHTFYLNNITASSCNSGSPPVGLIGHYPSPGFPANPDYDGTPSHFCYGMITSLYGGGLSSATGGGPGGGSYPALSRAQLAPTFASLRDPEYIHAITFATAGINQVYAAHSDLGALVSDWQLFSQFSIVPVLPDGQWLQWTDTNYDVTNGSPTGANNTPVNLSCNSNTSTPSTSPCLLTAVIPSTVLSASTITGKTSGTSFDIFEAFSLQGAGTGFANNGGAVNMIGKATAGGYFFGGCGVQTMEETPGNDVMAGYANCDGNAPSAQTYQFDAVRSGKKKQIGYKGHDGLLRSSFRTGTDKIKVSSTIFASQAAFIAACSTASSITTCNMGSGETLTIYDATTAPVAGDVTIF